MSGSPTAPDRNARTALAVLAVAAVIVLVPAMAAVTGASVPFRNDYAAYWPVATLLLDGQNPYDAGAIEEIQRSVGDTLGGDSVVRYPPWALPLLLPFAALPYVVGWHLWILLQIIMVGASSIWLWRLLATTRQGQGLALAIGLLFPPTLIMAIGGQIGGVLLLASTAFLWAADSRRDVIAGVCLGVLATKPHLFIPLAVVVILWTTYQHRPVIPVVAGLTIILGSVLAVSLRPAIFTEYVRFVQEQAPTEYLPSSLGGLIRLIAGTDKFWIQWIPAAVVLVLIFPAWARVRDAWTWDAYGAGVLALGLVSAPYGLVHDLVLLIPCLILLSMTVRPYGRALRLFAFSGFIAVCVGIWVGQFWRGTSVVQVWVAPLVLLVCIGLSRTSTNLKRDT